MPFKIFNQMKQSLLAVIFLSLFSQAATAWWNESWNYRKAIDIDLEKSGLVVGQNAEKSQLLLRLHNGNFGYFFDIKDGGADLRFMAGDDKTALNYYVEKLDPINGLALIWVEVPTLGQTNGEKIFMYYGNPEAAAAADGGAIFGVEDIAVYHFDDSSALPGDNTAYANNAVSFGGELNSASLIGSGVRFVGAEGMRVQPSPSLKVNSEAGFTFSAWIKHEAGQEEAVLFEISDENSAVSLGLRNGALVAKSVVASVADELIGDANLQAGQWQHVGLVVNGGQLSIMLDGAEVAQKAINPLLITGAVAVGSATSGSLGLKGEMDEVRLAAVARSPEWFKQVMAIEGKSSQLLSYGGDESKDGESSGEDGHSGYFGIIISNVFGNDEAIVEQIVIGFCGLMAIVSFLVMYFKAQLLMGARKSTNRFLEAYNKLGIGVDELDRLHDKRADYGRSPLFTIYFQGMEELKRRVSPSVGSQFAGLEQKSIEAIRASLDAAMIREGQQLNSQMVLLTIAISGGPFVGLLGTVVGVMVTFAGIAASGQVDINSIAPGMAAALLATVAGLGVAIPALFGYNYLGSRVKELSADMHVFADELVTRIGESYGR